MSRFAQTYEDPEYEYESSDDESTWQDVDTAPLGEIVDNWVRLTGRKATGSIQSVPNKQLIGVDIWAFW